MILSNALPLVESRVPPSRAIENSRQEYDRFELETRTIRRFIYLYLILWLVEGGLRRWVLPGLASPLLLIRDPVVLAIYWLALQKGFFPRNGFIGFGIALAILTIALAICFGHGDLFVALYGARCDFFHLPLIFIMARVLRWEDL